MFCCDAAKLQLYCRRLTIHNNNVHDILIVGSDSSVVLEIFKCVALCCNFYRLVHAVGAVCALLHLILCLRHYCLWGAFDNKVIFNRAYYSQHHKLSTALGPLPVLSLQCNSQYINKCVGVCEWMSLCVSVCDISAFSGIVRACTVRNH